MRKKLFFVVLGILVISMASAQINVANYSIGKEYGRGSLISGTINFSVQNELANSPLEIVINRSSFAITLQDFLNYSKANFSCNPTNCERGYNASNPSSEKEVTIPANSKFLGGFQLNGKINGIDDLQFSVSADSGKSCSPQLMLDLGNDGMIEYVKKDSSGSYCSGLRSYGCFNSSGSRENYYLQMESYCQKIKLPLAPGFKIGAWVKKDGNANLQMSLLDKEGNRIRSCNLPDAVSGGAEVFCDVNTSVTISDDYYVCISSDIDSNYQIIGNDNPSGICGYRGDDLGTGTGSYRIFAEPQEFTAFGKVDINLTTVETGEMDLASFATRYLKENYVVGDDDKIDCSSGCVFPIAFNSSVNQNVDLSSLRVKYTKESGVVSLNSFSDVSVSPAKINAPYQLLDLSSAKFSAPMQVGNYSFILKINGNEIARGNLSVIESATVENIFPKKISVGWPTHFYASISNNNNKIIKEYNWDFGDGSSETTLDNKAVHAYNSTGNYTLTLTVVDSSLFESKKSVNVEVGSAKDLVGNLTEEKSSNLAAIEDQIREFPSDMQGVFNSVLNTTQIDSALKSIQTRYKRANSEQDYVDLLNDLQEIKVPKTINISQEADGVTFFPDESKINLDSIASRAGGNAKSAETAQVLKWMNNNVKIKLDYKEYSAIYEDEISPVVRNFNAKIDVADTGYAKYLFIGKLDDINFQGSYGQKQKDGIYSIDLGSTGKTVSFTTTSDVDFVSLPLYVSPQLSRLPKDSTNSESEICNLNNICDGIESWTSCSDCRPIWLYVGIIVGLLILGGGIYYGMYLWYRKNYENSLFKNRNDLYNIVNYIHTSASKKMSETDIRKNLREVGWSSEQINYAIKRYMGKRTGLWFLGK